jgi:hypothetical protein
MYFCALQVPFCPGIAKLERSASPLLFVWAVKDRHIPSHTLASDGRRKLRIVGVHPPFTTCGFSDNAKDFRPYFRALQPEKLTDRSMLKCGMLTEDPCAT